MPIGKDVKEVLDMLKGLGLEPVIESGRGHYKVRDPSTGVYLFGVSSSPSDPNWRWMIMRHLRRLGYLQKDRYFAGRTKKGARGRRKKNRPAIDLRALKRAQEQAESRGERIPTLDDLDDSTEFFSKIRRTSSLDEYSEEAMEEVIETMVAKAEAPRVHATIQRLQKFMEHHQEELEEAGRQRQLAEKGHTRGMVPGKGARAEFVRIAINEVAPKRDLRAWKSEASGQQTLSGLLEGGQTGLSLWVLNLLEATMDHLDGLKWGEIDESRRLDKKPEPAVEPEPAYEDVTPEFEEKEITYESDKLGGFAPAIEGDVILPTLETTENHIRERYAEALLEILKKEGSQTAEPVLTRLDKLAGIA